MTSAQVIEEMVRLSRLIDRGVQALRDSAKDYAQAEHDYRLAKGQAWVSASDGTVPERQAWVEEATAKQRYARDLADGMRQAALEALRSRRAQLSALQSVANAMRSEAELAGRYQGEAA